MNRENFDWQCKLITIGDSNVGKTSVIRRFTRKQFSTNCKATIGVDYERQTMIINNETINVQIWDTAGHERHQSLPIPYYRSAKGVLTVYDITRSTSFENVENWIQKFKRYSGDNVEMMLIGNKCDLKDQREVEKSKGEQFAREHGMFFIETSAKENINVDDAFTDIVTAIAENHIGETISHSDELRPLEARNSQDQTCCEI